jgi:hypothetical protein
MKILVTAFALASLVATSTWAKTETPAPVRAGAFTYFKADRTVARPPAQSYALILGVAY